jgi:hypothetical protein
MPLLPGYIITIILNPLGQKVISLAEGAAALTISPKKRLSRFSVSLNPNLFPYSKGYPSLILPEYLNL